MPTKPTELDPDNRRVLDLLAASHDGSCPEAPLIAAHAATADQIAAMVEAGHVTIATSQCARATRSCRCGGSPSRRWGGR